MPLLTQVVTDMNGQHLTGREGNVNNTSTRLYVTAFSDTLHLLLRLPTNKVILSLCTGERDVYSSVVRVFAHGAMGRRVDPSWGGPIELFLVPVSAPRLV